MQINLRKTLETTTKIGIQYFKGIGCLLFLFPCFVYGQSTLNTKINLQLKDATLTTALEQIQQQSNINIAFSSTIVKGKKGITLNQKNQSLRQILNTLLKGTDLSYKADAHQIIIFKKKYYDLSGYVRDAETNELLTAVAIFCKALGVGTYTNEYGFFNLRLPKGQHIIQTQYIGVEPLAQKISLQGAKRLNIQLKATTTFEPVLVSQSHRSKDLANAPLGQNDILELSQQTPHIGGDPDLLHILRLQSGVTSSAGGIGGLYVRGGNTGHNLILLDGVPVYNWMHLLGINSIFNPDAVRGVQFHTSGFSARYGGRLSSVIDIQSKTGNSEEWAGMVGINQRSVQAQVSGPIFGNKTTLWIGGRQSIFAPYVKQILKNGFFKSGSFQDNSYVSPNYQDQNLKIKHTFNDKDRLFFSVYRGYDNIQNFEVETSRFGPVGYEVDYGNTTFSLRWNHLYNDKLFSNVTLSRSTFYNQYGELYSDEEGNTRSDIDFFYGGIQSHNEEGSLKADLDLFLKNHHIRFGGGASYYHSMPYFGAYIEDVPAVLNFRDPTIDSFLNLIQRPILDALEFYLYAEDQITLSKNTDLTLGLRATNFSPLYEAVNYFYVEPRLLLTTRWKKNWKTALSITKMTQALHQITAADVGGLPQDFWLPSTKQYRPSTAWQFTLDAQKDIQSWRLKGAAFYKKMNHLLMVPDNLNNFVFGTNLIGALLSGEGESAGLELSAFYKHLKFDFFGAYTLSRHQRQFDALNNGQPFPFQFDSRHYLQLLFHYNLRPNWTLGLRGHLSSPKPRLISSFDVIKSGFNPIQLSKNRNSINGPLEHRIDLSLNYTFKTNKLQHHFHVDLYNVYNQTNPVFFFIENDWNSMSSGLTLPFMFSVYYNLRF